MAVDSRLRASGRAPYGNRNGRSTRSQEPRPEPGGRGNPRMQRRPVHPGGRLGRDPDRAGELGLRSSASGTTANRTRTHRGKAAPVDGPRERGATGRPSANRICPDSFHCPGGTPFLSGRESKCTRHADVHKGGESKGAKLEPKLPRRVTIRLILAKGVSPHPPYQMGACSRNC